MKRYAAFLRGINVGGNATVNMSTLKNSLIDNGFKNVETYLNSGNIILETEREKGETEKQIQQIIEKEFGLKITIFIKLKEDIEYIVANNPFDSHSEIDNAKRMVVMFHDLITSDKETVAIKDEEEDANYYLRENLMYIYYKVGAGKAKITNSTIKQLLKQVSTSRNWNTINKILEKM